MQHIHHGRTRGASAIKTRKAWMRDDQSETASDRRRRSPDSKLDSQAVLLLVVHGMFAAANMFSGTFVNVYLWKMSNNFALIGWFALSNQVLGAMTFYLAGKWVKEHNKMNSLRLGVALSAVFYLVILLLGKQAVQFVLLLGALQGISAGFFWLAFNIVYFEITEPGNRDRFNGWAGLLGSAAGMIAPWISGWIITAMKNTTGYRIIFTISLVIFVVAVIVSFFLKKRKVEGHYEWLHSFRQLRRAGNRWRKVVPALMAQGMREGVFMFIIGLLVFVATKSEMKLGTYSLITSAVAIASFWLIGKILKPSWRSKGMLIGTVMMELMIVPFLWSFGYPNLLIFGIGVAMFYPLFAIPMTSSVFDLIGVDHDSAIHRVEYIVLRELALNAGRISGTAAFIVTVSLTASMRVLLILMLVIGSAPIMAWVLMRNGLLNIVHPVDKKR